MLVARILRRPPASFVLAVHRPRAPPQGGLPKGRLLVTWECRGAPSHPHRCPLWLQRRVRGAAQRLWLGSGGAGFAQGQRPRASHSRSGLLAHWLNANVNSKAEQGGGIWRERLCLRVSALSVDLAKLLRLCVQVVGVLQPGSVLPLRAYKWLVTTPSRLAARMCFGPISLELAQCGRYWQQ